MKEGSFGENPGGGIMDRLDFVDFNMRREQEGVSTEVYKLETPEGIFYLRVMPKDEKASVQALAHKLLIEQGVHVPIVESYKDEDKTFGSYMVVHEIGGTSLEAQMDAEGESNFDEVLFAAGQDLARVNSVPVNGFGRIIKNEPGQTELKAKYSEYGELFLGPFDSVLEKLQTAGALDAATVSLIKGKVDEHKDLLHYTQAVLAHGDLDMSHIFSKDGKYTGMIDFGGLQGASPVFDLAYFRFRCGPKYADKLIEGYRSVKELPEDFDARIKIEGLVIATKKLAWASKHMETKPARFEKAKQMLDDCIKTMTI